MEKIGIFYGSSTGNTESAAQMLQKEFGTENIELFDVADASQSDLEQFTNIIFGASTWGLGEMQDDFADFLSVVESANLDGKKVAIYGFGDQNSYVDTFVDAIGEIYESIKDKPCELVGKVSTDGYAYEASRAEVDGQFVGLPLDEDNQDNLTQERIQAWVADLQSNFI